METDGENAHQGEVECDSTCFKSLQDEFSTAKDLSRALDVVWGRRLKHDYYQHYTTLSRVMANPRAVRDALDIPRQNTVSWDKVRANSREWQLEEELVSRRKQVTAWIKDYEWRHERESRLCVSFKSIKPNVQAISIGVPRDLVRHMRFTLSPWLERKREKEVIAILQETLKSVGIDHDNDGSNVQWFRRSVLQGGLNFKES